MNMLTRGFSLAAILVVISWAMPSEADVLSMRQQLDIGPTLYVSPSNSYTHLLDFPNDGVSDPVNGVQFSPAPNGASTDPVTGNPYELSNAPTEFAPGNSAVLEDFYYNGAVETLTLGGLTPGEKYDMRMYYRDFGSRPQSVTIDLGSGPSAPVLIDQTPTGTSNAAYLSVAYVADSTEISIEFTAQVAGATWHQYAVSNQVLSSTPSAFGLYNTGVDDYGVLLGDGDQDPHYTLVSPSPVTPDTFTVPAGFPIGPWVANGPNSRWISPTAAGGANAPPGVYSYQTTLDLTGIDPNSVYITGQWSADDGGLDILVNGVSTGQVGTGFGGFVPFALAGKLGQGLISGVNTIEFVLNNGGAVGVDPPNPTGLRVDGVKVHGPSPVPDGTVAIAGLYNTGVSDDGFGFVVGDGAADPHYTMTVSPAGTVNPATALTSPPSPPWVPNDPTSRWIGPNNDASGNGPEGDYEYEISFDMAGLLTDTAVITGQWASDNAGIDILLNGVSTGNSQDGNFTVLHPFEVSAALGDSFLPGINTLTFIVNNAPASNNPTGLRVAGLTAYAQPVPEPTTLLLSLLGGMAMLGMRRRRSRVVCS